MLDTTDEAAARAEERLWSEEIAWLSTTHPDGQPQSVSVWFLCKGKGSSSTLDPAPGSCGTSK